MGEVAVGVVSGVLSALLVFLAGIFTRRILLPWYRSVTYSGIDVSGEWHCIDPSMAQEIVFNLAQSANSVSGMAAFTWDHDDEGFGGVRDFEVVRMFKVSGFIQDRFLQLTFRHVDRKRIGINSYLLEVCGDGRQMIGQFSFYSVRSNVIISSRHLVYRDRALAEQASGQEKELRRQKRLQLLAQLRQAELEEESAEEGEPKTPGSTGTDSRPP